MNVTHPDPAPSRQTFADGLRSFAVLWVVLHHLWAANHIPQLAALLPKALVFVTMELGYLGVSVFFVLSGYVMALTTHRLDVDGPSAGRFLLRRMIRLTPPLQAAVVVTVALAWIEAFIRPDKAEVPAWGNVLAHMTYTQDFLSYPRLNDVLWTLAIEVQFYLAFALMLWCADSLRRRAGWPWARMAVGAVAAIIAMPWALRWLLTPIWPGGFIGFWYSFMLGVLAGWTVRREPYAGVGLAALAGVVLFATVNDPFHNTIASLATTAALMLAHWRGAMGRWLNWRWWQFIALLSYSIYLFHLAAQGATAFVIRRVLAPSLVTDIVIFAALVAMPVLVAWIAWRLIEQPSMVWSRRIRVGPAPTSRPPESPR